MQSTSILEGFKSLCIILAEWTKFNAQRLLYKRVTICRSSIIVPLPTESNSFLKSKLKYSCTIKISLSLSILSSFISESSIYWRWSWFVYLLIKEKIYSSFEIIELLLIFFEIAFESVLDLLRRKLLIYSFVNPGAITCSIFGVYKLFVILESYLRIDISLRTFLAEYELLKAFGICLIATTLPEPLFLDLTTVPKLPLPTILYNSYSCWTCIHTQESYVNILVSFGINLDLSSKYIWD